MEFCPTRGKEAGWESARRKAETKAKAEARGVIGQLDGDFAVVNVPLKQ